MCVAMVSPVAAAPPPPSCQCNNCRVDQEEDYTTAPTTANSSSSSDNMMSSSTTANSSHHHKITIFTPFLQKKKPTSGSPPEAQPEAVDAARPRKGGFGSSSNPQLVFLQEAHSILSLAVPMVLTGLLLYSRSMVSMLFLGRLGELPLAGGALAICFANITGYSVLSGLAMGMEPICGQAFGARRPDLLGLAFQRTVLLLLSVSAAVAALWLNMRPILLLCGQDPEISAAAQTYILYSLPDLALQSFLHPLRIYLRTQSITMPLTYCATFSLALHLPINYLLVSVLRVGIGGVALAGVCTNFTLVAALLVYVYVSGLSARTGGLRPTRESFRGWGALLNLAIPSCVSVCLEWWWYEIMILLCGLLVNPKATVASMGILIQTTALIYIFPSSLSFGVSTRVSNELGANRPDRARRAAFVGLGCGFLLGLTAISFAFSVRNAWARMFTADGEILRLTAAVLPVIGLCELGNCPQTTGCGVLRGSARPRVGANVNLASFYAVGMPVAVGLGFWAGLDFVGLWMGLMAAQGTCVVAMLMAIRGTDWDVQAERAQKLTGGVMAVVSDDEQDVDVVVVKVKKVEEEEEEKRGEVGDEEESLLKSIKVEESSSSTQVLL